MSMFRFLSVSLAASLLWGSMIAQAATIVVDEVIDDNPVVDNASCSLREALIAANTNVAVDSCIAGESDATATDIIQFDASTDVGNAGPIVLSLAGMAEDATLTGDLDITSNVRFQGNGNTLTVVDAGALDRVFHLVTTAGRMVTFDDLEMTNGNPGAGNGGGFLVDIASTVTFNSVFVSNSTTTGNGGGIYSNNSQLMLSGSSVFGNSAADGGGIYIDTTSGLVTVNNGSVSGNVATGNGGGVNARGLFIAENGSAINNNDAASGGGIYTQGTTVTIDASEIRGNDALTLQGGGIFANVSTVNILNRAIIHSNTTPSLGGGIYNNNGTLTITDSIIFQNTATLGGAGILNISALSNATITRSTIRNNSTNLTGGGIRNANDATLSLVNSTVSTNSGLGDGSGIALTGSGTPTLTILSSTIALNTGSEALFVDSGTMTLENSILDNAANCNVGGGTLTSNGYNIDSANGCGFASMGDLVNTDPLLGILVLTAPGMTETHALLAGSPAIDVGNTPLTQDQRSIARPDGSADDIGSFELDQTPVLTEVTPIPTPSASTTPVWTFNSTDAGTITYSGSCSSPTTVAVVGNNTLIFDALSPGTYSNCSITVTDVTPNVSTPLMITTFEITGTATSGTNSGGGGGSSGAACAHISCLNGGSSIPEPPVTEEDSCAGYSDLSSNDSDCAAITYAQTLGAMTGNDDGTFGASDLLQRDQITKISLESFGLFDSNEDYCLNANPFPDVTHTAWSYQYVCRGKQLGMITGYESGGNAGMFVPGSTVNLVEFWALMLRNLDVVLPLGPSFNGWLVDAWYSGYAQYVADNNLYDGLPSPTELVSRRDVAVFLYELHLLGAL